MMSRYPKKLSIVLCYYVAVGFSVGSRGADALSSATERVKGVTQISSNDISGAVAEANEMHSQEVARAFNLFGNCSEEENKNNVPKTSSWSDTDFVSHQVMPGDAVRSLCLLYVHSIFSIYIVGFSEFCTVVLLA